MCAVLRLFEIRAMIDELEEVENELAREVAEVMGPGVTEFVIQDVADEGLAIWVS